MTRFIGLLSFLRSTNRISQQSSTVSASAQIFRTQPDIEGLMLDGRWAVFFSPYDLSCALESRDPVECAGYTREDAARLALNILLYSLEHE